VRLEWRRTVGVGRRRRRSGVSPRFSAYGIKPSSVYGKSYSTAIIGFRAPAIFPLFMWRCAMGPTAIHGKRPRSGRELDWIPNSKDLFKRKGDRIPNSVYLLCLTCKEELLIPPNYLQMPLLEAVVPSYSEKVLPLNPGRMMSSSPSLL
jgi:hypothetical protein